MSGCSTGSQKVVSSKPTLPFCCHTHPNHLKQWELLNGWDELYICELILGRFFHSRGPVTASELRNCLFGTSGHIPLQLRRSTSNNLLENHDVTLPKLLPQFQLSLFFEFAVLWSRDACFFLDTLGRRLCHPISGELAGNVKVPGTIPNEIANSLANGSQNLGLLINIFVFFFDFPR